MEKQNELVRSLQEAIWNLEKASTQHYKNADYKNNYNDYEALKKMQKDLVSIGNRVKSK